METNINVKKTTVPEEEIWLNTPVVPLAMETNSKTNVSVGIDVGTTSSRLNRFDDEEGTVGDKYELDSDITNVTDISNLKSLSNSVYSNIEVIIKDITSESIKPEKIFTEEHFVKCELGDSISGAKVERASQVSKTKNKATYLNLLTHLALDQYVHNNGLLYGTYEMTLAIALPPEDFKSHLTTDFFLRTLAGTYSIKFPRMNIGFNIKISSDNVFLEKEPNAVQYSLASDDEELLESNSMVIDGGGKTTDINIMKDGRILDKYAQTLPIAGNYLIAKIQEIYMQETGKSKPPKESVSSALVSGILVRGGKSENIFNIIDKCKRELAEDIYNGALQVLDATLMSPEDLKTITFHGRLFLDTISEDGKVSSIKQYCIDMFSKLADIEYNVVTTTDCICHGVVISRWVELFM